MSEFILHDETVSFIEKVEKLNLKPYHETSVEEARLRHESLAKYFSGNVDFDGVIIDDKIANRIPIRIYKPTSILNLKRDNNNINFTSILVYFHGGGMVIGSINSFDNCCRSISKLSKIIVISIGYSLAPEHKWPAQYEDCYTATKWIIENKLKIADNLNCKIGIGGDSAGGTLASSLAYDLRVDYHILIYPQVIDIELKSIEKYANAPGLSKASIKWFCNKRLSSTSKQKDDFDQPDEKLYPYYRKGCENLSPVLIILAQIDPLYDEGMKYYEKLKSCNVDVTLHEIKGVCHGFFHMTEAMKTNCSMAYNIIAKFIEKQLN